VRNFIQILESIQFLSLRFVYSILNKQIFPSDRDLLEKLTVPQIFEPVTCSYPELDKDHPRLSHPHYLKLNLLGPPFTSRSSKWSHSFRFPQQTPVCMPFPPMHAAIPTAVWQYKPYSSATRQETLTLFSSLNARRQVLYQLKIFLYVFRWKVKRKKYSGPKSSGHITNLI
jgi:hypothetical protein